jgi:serine protease
LPPERPSWAQEQTQWYLKAMNFPQAWDLLGDDDFDSNPAQGFYGTANVAVLDSGLDPQCDPHFEPVPNPDPNAPITCRDPAYPNAEVLFPHAQLQKNLRRLQSFGATNPDPASFQFTTYDIISSRDGTNGTAADFSYSTASTPLGVDGNPNRRVPGGTNGYVVSVGHGTHVAGLIAAAMDGVGTVGTCPTCSLNYFVVNGAGENVVNNMANRALALATSNSAQVISMSFGGLAITPTLMLESGVLEPTSVLNTLIAAAADSQIFLVASAGNNINSTMPAPANHPKVLAVGGTMADYTIVNGVPTLGINYWSEQTAVSGARCGPSSTVECGSRFSIDAAKKMLYAPAARILSTMHGTWTNVREVIGSVGNARGLAACTTELFPVNTRSYVSSDYASFNSHYGMCTGTSMSAPILSGLAGLVRSANPLLTIDDTYTALKYQATAIGGTIPGGALNTQQPLADSVVTRVLGEFGGAVAQNRLVPMFAVNSSVRTSSSGIVTANIDWLYSTKPQVLRGAMLGDTYYLGASATNAGTRQRVNYDTATTLPPFAGYSYGNTLKSGSPSTPRGSFYLFATQRRPLSNTGTERLVPLYRLATDSPLTNGACDARKHTYATPGSLVNGGAAQAYFEQTSRPRCAFASGAASPPAAGLARYAVVAIEGFVYSPIQSRPAGTVALYLRYSNAAQSFALVTENDVNRPEYAGYGVVGTNSTDTVLGFVYENDAVQTAAGAIQTSDGDDWPANWELAVGLNADRTDSDCDGVSDSIEYPLASLPVSDPKLNTCTAATSDSYAVARIVQSTPKAVFKLRNYLAATSNITFKVIDGNSGAHSLSFTPPVGATCTPNKPNTLPNNQKIYTCTMNLAPGINGNAEVIMDFGVCNAGNSLDARVQITSPDSYVVNNDVTVNVCP